MFAVPLGLYGDEKKSSEPKVTEWRRHFEIKAKDGTRLYEGTEITRLTDLSDEKYVLVRDEGHGDFLMWSIWNFRSQMIQHRIADVKDRAFLQLSYKMPFTSPTRQETLKEGRSNPILAQGNALLRLETNAGIWEGAESEWNDPARLRSLRHSVRSNLDRFLLETIERGRGWLFSAAEGEPFFSLVGRYAVYDADELQEAADAEAMPARAAAPNCEFDEAFGYPCTEVQKARIKKAAKENVIPEMY